jgi:pimeloyl-ACP methyl ester carboxylesterase
MSLLKFFRSFNHYKFRFFSTIKTKITTNNNEVKWVNGLEKRSHFIEFDDHRLHLLQINKEGIISKDSPAVLLLHGAISNGLQFYSIKGQGLAPYLASKGMNIFVADLRGRGLSTPSIKDDPNSKNHGM